MERIITALSPKRSNSPKQKFNLDPNAANKTRIRKSRVFVGDLATHGKDGTTENKKNGKTASKRRKKQRNPELTSP